MSEQTQTPDIQPDEPAATPEAAPSTNGASAPPSDELRERIAQLERENAELKDQVLRAVADYKNYKRRSDQERAELIRSASSGLLLKLLPVMDDLERAVASVTPDVEATQWYGGFKLIPHKLQTVLESEGLTPMQAVGEPFDPNRHEAVIFEPAGDGQDGAVVAELQRGYLLRDRVLRPAMVKVGKG